MLLVLIYWIVTFFVAICFGDIISMLWNRFSQSENKYSLPDLFWLGLAFIASLSCFTSLFLPLNIYVKAVIVAITIVYWGIERIKFISLLKVPVSFFNALPLFQKIGAILILFLLLAYSLSIPTGYDINLYHLQSLIWNEQYSVVPGLGNLHGRLSFNSNSLLLYNIFSFHSGYFTPNFAINGLCILVFSFWTLKKISERSHVWEMAGMYVLLFIFYFAFAGGISSSSTDILANIIVLYLFLKIILDTSSFKKTPLVFLILPFFCLTLKISVAFIVLLSLPVLLFALKERNYRIIGASVFCALFLLLPWLTRSVVLSGYLVYPFPAIDIFTFDWKIPLDAVLEEKEAIVTYAKVNFLPQSEVAVMPFSEWIPIWFKNLSKLYALTYILCALSPLVFVYVRLRQTEIDKTLFLVWGIAFLGALFGFVNAPDPRFSIASLLCVFIIPFFFILKIKVASNMLHLLNIAACIIVLLFMAKAVKDMIPYQKESALTLVYKPQDFYYVKKYFNISFKKNQMAEGIIYSPDSGDQCYDHCIPCSPYLDKKMEFRGFSLGEGFRMKK